jgi:hypothetical protein
MDQAVRDLRIKTYKEQLAACNQVCAALSKELDKADLPEDKRLAIGHRWDEAMKESNALQFLLDRLKQEKREDQTGQQFELG